MPEHTIQNIRLQGEEVALLPERALWWPRQKALVTADIHWAKSAHFRQHGLAMPAGIQAADGIRLAGLIRQYKPDRLIVAGDFFHSRYNAEVADFTHWRRQHQQLCIDFVIGNHDILPAQLYEQWNLNLYPSGMELSPFFIAHDEELKPDLYTLHGHLHPGVRLGKGRPLAAFCQGTQAMVLPAFGSFTGCKIIAPQSYEHIFVVGEGKVLQLK